MANTSISLVGLDFETIKNNLVSYLKRSDSPFKDANFDGSNISQLVDVLAYNSYLNSFYLNMVASEMFLDSAQMRESVVSHAKELNYVPRSFTSARAKVSFTIYPSSPIDSIVVLKGTTFTSKLGSNTYTFSTDENQIFNINSSNTIEVSNLSIYEGTYTSDSFVYNIANTQQRFVLSNPTVDVSSLSVRVIENNGANVDVYTRASSFLGLGANSKVFFLQAAENSQYEILFGDGVIGTLPKSGSVIVAQYRICNGQLPNGTMLFDIDGPVQGQANISSINTVEIATGGSINESIESIKFNAPRYYQNQERAVTTSDYENLLRQNFAEIQAVSAYGGENVDPPQYGKVFISIDIQNADGIPDTTKATLYEFIKPRSPLSIDPVIVEPDFLYLKIDTNVSYNINITSLPENDISTFVKTSISNYNLNYLSNFKKTLRYSNFVKSIDSSHASIISNETSVSPYKIITPNTRNKPETYTVDFGFSISNVFKTGRSLKDNTILTTNHNVKSSTFIYDNKECYLQDDGFGTISLISNINNIPTSLLSIGVVDYNTGIINLKEFIIQDYSDSGVKLYVLPLNKDIPSDKNTIIKINDSDINVTITKVRI